MHRTAACYRSTHHSDPRGWFAALALMFGLLTLATPATAEFLPVTDPAFRIAQARPILDSRTQTYLLDVSVAYSGVTALPGQYRLVVASANKTALEPMGTTAANEPFYGLLSGQGATFAAGTTLRRQLKFSGGRGQLVATLRLEREIPAPPNEPPTANAGPAQTLTLASGQTTLPVTLDGSASADPDGSIASYQWTGSPQPASVAQPQIALPVGVHQFSLVVTDNAGAVSTPATVSVTVAAAPPEAAPRAPSINVDRTSASIDTGGLVTVAVSATDPDDDVVTLSASPALPNASFSAPPAVNPSGSFSFTPRPGQTGRYMVEFTARDRHGLTASRVVEIAVNPVNTPPSLTVEPQYQVQEGGQLAIPLTVSDPEGDAVTLGATVLPANAVLLSAPGLLQFAPDFDQAGTYDLVITANDGLASVSAPVRILVTDVAAGSVAAGALTLAVNPTQSPSFQTRARVTGAVNAAGGEPQLPPTPFAVIASLAPVNTAQGERVTVVLGGAAAGRWATHFEAGRTTADFGDGIAVEQVQVSSPTAVAVTLLVAADAAPGVRQVRLTTGDEIAVSVLGFRVEPGVSSVSGVLRDTDTGAPIAGAVVGIEGSDLRVITAADGSFTLNGVPTGERTLLVNAPNHGLIRRPVSASPGAPVVMDDLTATPTVAAADAAPAASVPSLLQRGLGDPTRPMSLDAAQAIVRDALMLVGGMDIGILDADGNQQNPEVGGDIPFFSLNEDSVATIAERMLASERRTLGEVLYEHTLIWNWDGDAPTLSQWVSALQTLVNQAWANPGDRRYALLFLLFNPERGLLSSPPTIVADTPLNALQATLMELTLLRYGSRTVDPEALHDRIVVDYPELAAGAASPGTPTAQGEAPGLFARLLQTLVPPAFAADPLKAAAERAAYEIHVREKVSLAARADANPEVAGLSYQWTLLATPPGGANAAFTRTNERIAYLQPTLSGEYRLRLAVSAPGRITAETEVVVTAGDPCNANFDFKLSNADATWEELACVFAMAVPKGLTQGAVTGQFWGWLKGATPISSYDAKLAAANNIKGFNVTNGIGYQPARITAMKGLEVALPAMMKTAQTQGKIHQATKFSVKLLLSSTAGFIQGQAAQMSRDIMYGVLDITVLMLVDSIRPAPPTEVSAEPITSPGITGGVAVLLIFDRSPSEDAYIENHQANVAQALDEPTPEPPQHFYYKIYRQRSGGILEQIYVGTQSADGPLQGFSRDGDGQVMLTFVDAAPPAGQLAYYVKTRRIRGSKQVNIEEWSEAKFWTEQIMGVLSPPGLNQYSFAAAMSEKGVKLLKQMQLQDSDPSLPGRLYVPSTMERVKLPMTLAATPVVGPYTGEVLMGVPEQDAVFSYKDGARQPLLNSGFATPFIAGMAVDALGNIYLNNAASQERFGGRIFRWNPMLERTLFGSVQYFSQLLMYAPPVAVQAMTAGWMNGGQRLYLADNVSDTLRELVILPDNSLPPNPSHYVSQPITSPGQVPIRADITMAVNGSEGELLVADGDNLFRYRDGDEPVSDRLFAAGASPFTHVGGIDADANGNLYIGDSTTGELLVIPADRRDAAFYDALKNEPWRRSLYTLASGLPEPGELRVAGHQRSVVWLDLGGLHQFAFGFSGRLVDEAGEPIAGARVSVDERSGATEVLTDEYGVFRLSGLRGPGLSDTPLLLVRTTNGEACHFRILLNQVGHTFAERMEFLPILPPPDEKFDPVIPDPEDIDPPKGKTLVVKTRLPVKTPAPVPYSPIVEILSPANNLETDQREVTLDGFALGGILLSATLEVNGVASPLTLTDGNFSAQVPITGAVTRLRVYVEALTATGQPVVGSSQPVLVYANANPSTGALVGRVTDELTGLPVPGVSAQLPALGLSAISDRNGVWRIDRVPAGPVTLELVP